MQSMAANPTYQTPEIVVVDEELHHKLEHM